jgi:hypothetical protein
MSAEPADAPRVLVFTAASAFVIRNPTPADLERGARCDICGHWSSRHAEHGRRRCGGRGGQPCRCPGYVDNLEYDEDGRAP